MLSNWKIDHLNKSILTMPRKKTTTVAASSGSGAAAASIRGRRKTKTVVPIIKEGTVEEGPLVPEQHPGKQLAESGKAGEKLFAQSLKTFEAPIAAQVPQENVAADMERIGQMYQQAQMQHEITNLLPETEQQVLPESLNGGPSLAHHPFTTLVKSLEQVQKAYDATARRYESLLKNIPNHYPQPAPAPGDFEAKTKSMKMVLPTNEKAIIHSNAQVLWNDGQHFSDERPRMLTRPPHQSASQPMYQGKMAMEWDHPSLADSQARPMKHQTYETDSSQPAHERPPLAW